MKTYLVTLYECNRSYGGSEEGGWWYDCGERLKGRRIFTFRNEDAAYSFCARYNRRLARWVNKGYRRNLSSVCCEGAYHAIANENCLPDYFPEERPRYE